MSQQIWLQENPLDPCAWHLPPVNFCKGQKPSQAKPSSAWTTSMGCRGCLLLWGNQSGPGVRHQGKQTDLEETKYACCSFQVGSDRPGNGAGPGAGRMKAVMGKQVLIQIYFPFCSTRALHGPGKCSTTELHANWPGPQNLQSAPGGCLGSQDKTVGPLSSRLLQ